MEGNPTLLDIVKANGSDLLTGLIEEVKFAAPEVSGVSKVDDGPAANVGSARTVNDIFYKTLVRIELPGFSFRKGSKGVADTKSKWENRLVECYIANPRWSVDKAIAEAHEDGWEAFLGLEGIGHTKSMMLGLSKQFYYGTGNDANGHPGVKASVDASMIVDATGSTPDTATSVYAVKFGPQDVQWVVGKQGTMSVTDVREIDAEDDDGNKYTALRQEILGWIGLQVGSKNSVARIKNVTAQTGKTLNDDMLADLIEKFPAGVEPDAIFMTKRSRTQWKKSRTATNATGAPAPTPTDYEGIPVFVTDGLVNTEAIEA